MIVVPEKKALIVRPRDPAHLLALIPTARELRTEDKTFVAMPHRLDETRVLSNLGMKPPSPIRYYYKWSGQYTPFKAQMDTAEFLTLRPRAYVLNEMGCVDASTEYLSPTGWRRIDQYDGGVVAQYVPETGKAEFVRPTEYVKKPCVDMIRFKTSRGVDQLLSPEHRVLYVTSTGTKLVNSAENILRAHKESKFGWKGRFITTFDIDGEAGVSLTNEQLRVQVALQADGHFPTKNGTKNVTVRLKKERKKARLRQLLVAAGIEWKEKNSTAPTAAGFTVFRFPAPIKTKTYTWAWACSQDQLRVIADEVFYWDGSNRKAGGDCFFTRDKESADFIQYALCATGRTARLLTSNRVGGTDYIVHARKDAALLYACGANEGVKTDTIYPEPSPDGFKYCFMVPSTFLVLRRNGCVFMTGNTGKSMASLWAYDYLRSIGVLHRLLVVCPLSTMERTWADEVFKHFPHLDYAVLHGSKERRKKLLAQPADVYIVNHDGLAIISDDLAKREDIDLVISDEVAQSARNANTDRWRAQNLVVNQQVEARRWCWGMTGTPTPNEPTDAWAQCKLITPGTVPPYKGRFRDMVMKQAGMYKWIPRPDAMEKVYAVMSPAIRFSRKECVDLPECVFKTEHVDMTPAQQKAYKEMFNQLKAQVAGGEVLAVNEAVKTSKLVQIACLAGDTDVLTDTGWKRLDQVTPLDLVWDGLDWVEHDGVVCNGYRSTIVRNGVELTPDHLVRTEERGWVQAEEVMDGDAGEGLVREKVRLPGRAFPSWFDGSDYEVRDMAMSLRLRERSGSCQPRTPQGEPAERTELRLQARCLEQDARRDAPRAVPHLDGDAAALREPDQQRLRPLRRAWDRCVRAMEGLRRVLGGHGTDAQAWTDTRPEGQQRPVLAGQLSMGNTRRAGEESATKAKGADSRTFHKIRHPASNAVLAQETRAPVAPVFDIVNCGPRNRFVVRGVDGELMIVHNCGIAYDRDGNEVTIGAKPRLELTHDIILQASGKVIVFVPFVSSVNYVADYLRGQGLSVECIYGEVSKSDRDRIFQAFQKTDTPRVLVAQPAAMSHGLTLTAANTIIWYAPIFSNDIYDQACARITRPGQKLQQLIVNIEGSPVEQRMYQRLASKQKMQGILLSMVEDGREE